MVLYKSKDFKVGLKVLFNTDPYIIIGNEFFKPGKGKAFNRLKLRNMVNNKIIKKTLKIGEGLEEANIFEKKVKYLYFDNIYFHFVDIKSFNYYEIKKECVGTNVDWIKEDLFYMIILWNDIPLCIDVPKVIVLKVISTDDISKNDIIMKNFKFCKLETGVIIKTPVFIKENDLIKIDTDKRLYISRVND